MIPTIHLPINLPFDVLSLPVRVPPKPRGTPNRDSFSDLAPVAIEHLPLVQLWGVYDSGLKAQIFSVDTCISIKPDSQAKIANFPIEAGGFTSYNKVQNPQTCKVQLGVSGMLRIQTFLAQLDAVSVDTNLYSVVTPEKVFKNMNLEKFSYQRSVRDGQNLLKADLTFTEIRTANVAFTNAIIKAPSVPKAKPKAEEGIVQTLPGDLIRQARSAKTTSPDEVNKVDSLANTLHDTGLIPPTDMQWLKDLVARPQK